jgi:hypothetical protein
MVSLTMVMHCIQIFRMVASVTSSGDFTQGPKHVLGHVPPRKKILMDGFYKKISVLGRINFALDAFFI